MSLQPTTLMSTKVGIRIVPRSFPDPWSVDILKDGFKLCPRAHHFHISHYHIHTTYSRSRYFPLMFGLYALTRSPRTCFWFDRREKGICPDSPGAVHTEVSPHIRRGTEVQLLNGAARRLRFPQQIGTIET